METWNCRDWKAWHDHQPPGPWKLHVTGECEMPTPGYELYLEPAVPQGINPKDLILILHVKEPTGPQPQHLAWTPVHWEQETDVEYDTVSIRGIVSGIPVEDVH